MKKFVRREGGQVAVLFALMLMAMLFMVGLAIDVGMLFVAHRTAQEAADAGAYGGAIVIHHNGSTSAARAAAIADTLRNGFVDGGDGGLMKVWVNIPPQSGPYSGGGGGDDDDEGGGGNPKYVEVIIEIQVRTLLVPGQGVLNRVVVRGVAGAAPVNFGHAIMALNQNVNDAFLMGNGDVNVTGGGIHINSNACGPALKLGSDGDLNSPYTRVRGCYDDGGSGDINPDPITGVPYEPDPFAGLGTPSSDLTNHGEVNISSCGTYTLNPGIYDGLNLSSSACTTVNMKPGIYIVRKKGINLSGDMTLQMDPDAEPTQGVLIFNTIESFPFTTAMACDKMNFSGNGVLDLRAASDGSNGAFDGMLFYQDRRCTAEFYVSGNGEFHAISGTIYLPQAPFHISGNGTWGTWNSRLIAQTFKNSGNADFRLHYDADQNANPEIPALVE